MLVHDRRVDQQPGRLGGLADDEALGLLAVPVEADVTSTRMPPPKMNRHFRSRLVSPSRCLKVRYDISARLLGRLDRTGVPRSARCAEPVAQAPGLPDRTRIEQAETTRSRLSPAALPRPAVGFRAGRSGSNASAGRSGRRSSSSGSARRTPGKAGPLGRTSRSGPGSPLRARGPSGSPRRSSTPPPRSPRPGPRRSPRGAGRPPPAMSARRRPLGMDPGPEQDLVGVDVADPGQHLLVHQGRLDRPAGPRQAARPGRRGAISRASGPCDRAKAASAASAPAIPGDLAQPSVVAEPDRLARPFQLERQAHVVGSIGRDQPKPSRHPGLDDDQSPVVRPARSRPTCPAARPARHRAPRHPAGELLGRRTPGAGTGRAPRPPRSSCPTSAGRSPRTIVSTSGNSGIAALSLRLASTDRLYGRHSTAAPTARSHL